MRGSWLGMAALCAAWMAPAGARAYVSYQALISLSGGYNSNVSLTETEGGTGQPQDAYGEVRPTLVLNAGGRRMVNTLAYTFHSTIFVTRIADSIYSNSLQWSGAIYTSPVTTLLLSANLTQSGTTTINTSTDSSLTTLGVAPRAGTLFLNGQLNESFQWELSPTWRLGQLLSFNAFTPLRGSASTAYFLNQSLSAEHLWRRDGFGATLRVDYANYSALRGPITRPDGSIDPDGELAPGAQQLITAITPRWRRDFGAAWNFSLEAGALLVMKADGSGRTWQPTGQAALHYFNVRGDSALSYAHTVTTSALVGQTYAIDQVLLRGSLPLGQKSRVVLSGSAGYQYGQQVDRSAGGLSASAHVYLADATLLWSPFPVLSIFTRYQFTAQTGNPEDQPPLPSFLRHLVAVGITGTYPPDVRGPLMPRPGRRVDGSDVTMQR